MNQANRKPKSVGQTMLTWCVAVGLVIVVIIMANLSGPEISDPPYWDTTEGSELHKPVTSEPSAATEPPSYTTTPTFTEPTETTEATTPPTAPPTAPPETQPPTEPRLPSVPDSMQSHLLLNTRGYGCCTKLTGDVVLTVIFVNDPDSTWTASEIQAEKQAQSSAVSVLTSQAASYGVSLNLSFNYLEVTVSEGFLRDDYNDWMKSVLASANLSGISQADRILKEKFGADQTPVLFLSNKPGRSFAVSQRSGSGFEYAFLYQDNGAFQHELLHMFGAKDYYAEAISGTATAYFSECIMLDSSCTYTDSLTAYLVGWTDSLDTNALGFLTDTANVTQAQLDEVHDPIVNGYGTLKFTGGGTYTGDIYEGIAHGQGTCTYPDGAVYTGSWDNGYIHGYGTFTYSDGGTYTGQFSNGNRHGQGTYYYPNGTVYDGSWVNGDQTGQGTITYANGNTYTGNFVTNHLNGQGTYVFKDGTVYIGQLKDDYFNGNGTMTYTNGDVYVGGWLNGYRHGQGTYTFADGTVKSGTWDNGSFVG